MSIFVNRIEKIKAIHDYVLVADMPFEERRTRAGIVLMNDDGKSAGIRPRWAKVFSVGPDQHDIKVGDWVCVSHGRWTRGVTIETQDGTHVIRRIDPNDVLLMSDIQPNDETLSDKV
jgi:co-chaperonin GroES (HSP10)